MRREKTTSMAAVWAVVPAAGLGRRMAPHRTDDASQPGKQLLDVAGRPMLARVLDVIDASGAAACIAVINAQIAPAIRALRPENDRRHYVVNPQPESEMIESIQLGLRTAGSLADSDQTAAFSGDRGFLICPGDHPCITAEIIDRCIEAFGQNPTRVVIATNRGRRGHPLIVPADLAFDVLSWPPTRGLNELRRLHADRVHLTEVDDPGVLLDVDTPADLEQARKRIDWI